MKTKRRSDQQFNIHQASILEQIFKIDKRPDYQTRLKISNLFNRTEKSIDIWFYIKREQNIYIYVEKYNDEWDSFDFLNFLK